MQLWYSNITSQEVERSRKETEDYTMLEVTFFDGGLEVGTFDIESSEFKVGSIVMDTMKIVSITLNPTTGEDATCAIEYV